MQVVIDTQTVLDWQFFANPTCQGWPLPGSADCGWIWLATAAMRQELSHVLHRRWPGRWTTPAAQVMGFFDAHVRLCPPPASASPAAALRCTDPDDQKFIDLALAQSPCLLLTRDRALLKLARRAAARQVQVLQPGAWHPSRTTTCDR